MKGDIFRYSVTLDVAESSKWYCDRQNTRNEAVNQQEHTFINVCGCTARESVTRHATLIADPRHAR